MNEKQKKQLARIGVAGAGFLLAVLLPVQGIIRFAVFLAVYLFIGWDILWSAARRIVSGQVFDENFLMAVATVGAFVLGEYAEGVAVMLFYQVGEWFQGYAVAKSRRSITELMNIRPDTAHRRLASGELETVEPEEIAVGEEIVVKPGERVPLDGILLDGFSALDTSALTGESLPQDVQPGQEVLSGCVNLSGTLVLRVEKPFGDSTVARILQLVESAGSKKAEAENFITKFSRYYTPAVCIAALLLAVVPPLFTGFNFAPWVYRALTFLVVSCPCALVISIPLSFFGGIGGASRSGILVKGGVALEQIAKAKTVIFDKTGTLTKGKFAVSAVMPSGMSEENLLEYAAAAEMYSTHPIALSIREAYGADIPPARVADVTEEAGQGVRCQVDGQQVMAGKPEWLLAEGIAFEAVQEAGTIVSVAVGGQYAGSVVIQDTVKPDAKIAISRLKELGVRITGMFTGDSQSAAEKVAQQVGVDMVYARLYPADKVEKLEELLARQAAGETLAFVGDGINDAPVLARADIGVAMGGLGSDAAIEAADIVIMTDEPSKVATAMVIAKNTMAIVKQNIIFALGVKLLVLVLGVFGIATMWEAVFADVGVSVLAILNAMRALKKQEH